MQVLRANLGIPTGNPVSDKVATQSKHWRAKLGERGLTQSCRSRLGERLLFKYRLGFTNSSIEGK